MFRALALVVVLAGAAAARADSTDLARRHYQSGSAYFEEGRYDEAAREFRESYRLAPRVDLLFNIAKCFDKKGDAARAVEAYRTYLDGAPGAADVVAIRATVDALAAKVGTVRLEGAPLGAEVRVDGEAIGHAPLEKPLTATAGRRRIEARPIDGAPRVVEVDVVAGGEVAATLPPPKEVVKEVVKERLVVVAPTWYRSKLGWGLLVAGALVAVAGVACVGAAPSLQSSERSGATTEAAFRAADGDAKNLQYAGAALLSVGAVALVAGVVVFALRARRDRPAPGLGLAF